MSPPDSVPPDSAPPDSAAPDSAPPDSAPPDSAPPDSAPPDSAPPDSAPPDSAAPDSTPPDSSPPSSATPDSSQPDSSPDSSPPSSAPPGSTEDCAEIPAAAHAVLEADVKLVLRLPAATDPSQPTSRLTLTNDDASYTKSLTYPSDAQPSDSDGIVVMTYDGLTDGHTYSLQCDDGSGAPYFLFQALAYEELVPKLTRPDASSSSDPPASSPSADPGATS